MPKEKSEFWSDFWDKARTYFIRGLIVIAPITITAFIVISLIEFFDNLMTGIIPPKYRFPGIGLITVLVVIYLIGYLSGTLVFQPIFRLIQNAILRIRPLRLIYSTIQDLFNILNRDVSKLGKPVMVAMDSERQVWKLGFLTREKIEGLPENLVAVYLPHSYNFSGNLFLVHRDRVEPLEHVPPAEQIKFIVSGGLVPLKVNRQDVELEPPSVQAPQDEKGAKN
ncbi:MAG: DUF502 domain-containing protein [Chlorobi bacterium]|nr:DUF502 domain-containing protein [Chlorobiota bacterium]